jgi:dihydropteroate synthase
MPADGSAWSTPKILGVLNVTDDSFSDGGFYRDPDAAIAHARALVEAGADIVDVGAVASNPDSVAVPAEEEIRRLDPVIATLQAQGAEVSIDSFRPATQRHVLASGVAMLNDIHGFPHADIYPDIARAKCGLIVMHSVHGAAHVSRADVAVAEIMETILRFFETRVAALTKAGIDRSRLILDPGMGYFLGANPADSFAALAGLPRLRDAFGLPILVGVSRKSFLRAATGRSDPAASGPATLAAEVFAALAGVDYIRTHDVAALRDALAVLAAIRTPKSR